jgi:hypothetical protein
MNTLIKPPCTNDTPEDKMIDNHLLAEARNVYNPVLSVFVDYVYGSMENGSTPPDGIAVEVINSEQDYTKFCENWAKYRRGTEYNYDYCACRIDFTAISDAFAKYLRTNPSIESTREFKTLLYANGNEFKLTNVDFNDWTYAVDKE